jgi:hypothetical protein
MIEALVNHDTGDVIVVKPAGSVWGRCEVNAVVLLDDPELEKALATRPHIVYPYAAWHETTRQVRIGGEVNILSTGTLATISSLVKIDLTTANVSSDVSAKSGVLTADDADTPVAEAKINNVSSYPVAKPRSVNVKRDRALPEVK